MQQRESAVSTTYISSLLSLPPAHSLSPHRYHRASDWVPCVVQQLSILHMVVYRHRCYTLNSSHLLLPPLRPPVHQTRISNHSTTAASWCCGGDTGPHCLRGRQAEEGSTSVLHECWAGFQEETWARKQNKTQMQRTVGPDLENKAGCQSQQEKCTTESWGVRFWLPAQQFQRVPVPSDVGVVPRDAMTPGQ